MGKKNYKSERFAAIFWHITYENVEIEECLFENIALVDFDEKTGKFTVKNGNFKGSNEKSFGQIIGPPEFVFKENEEMEVKGEQQFKIYIFDNDFVKGIKKKNNYDDFTTYMLLTDALSEVRLVKDKLDKNNNKFVARQELQPMYMPLEKIERQLYGKNTRSFEEQDRSVETIEIPVDLSEVLPLLVFDSILSGVEKEQNTMGRRDLGYETKKLPKANSKQQIDIKKIIDEISDKIVGQDEAIKTLVSNIYFNQVLIDTLSKNGDIDESELDSRKISILLDGSTGTGKTAIAKEIASKLQLPIEIVNANSFSETGYVGPTITDILSKLLDQANGNLAVAERGIVVLDEIDKIATNAYYDGRDMKQGVQEELLAFIGGGKYEIKDNVLFAPKTIFDTSKLTFILSGAFTRLRETKIKEARKNKVGFNTEDKSTTRTYTITPQDYIDYGLLREFFGRVKVLTSTKTYTIEDLKTILLESSISPLKNFEKTVKMFGYEGISYNDEFIENLAKKAYEMETGARGLQTIMSGIQNKMLVDLVTKQLSEKITLTEEMLQEYEKGNQRSY